MAVEHATIGDSPSPPTSQGQEFEGEAAPHEVTLAVWGMPEAVAAGQRFTVKVGAKSSAGCVLRGGRIEIRDAGGATVGTACLGETPWPGTSALFWAEVELRAPVTPGLLTLSAQFDDAEGDPPHRGAAQPFSVAIVEQSEHMLTVKVIAKETQAPGEDVLVRIGPYRATTTASGLAEVRTPKGHFELQVWKAGYEAPITALDVTDDASVEVEIVAVPEEDPDAHWTA